MSLASVKFVVLFLFIPALAWSNDCPTISLQSGFPNIVNPECGLDNGSIEVQANGQGAVSYSIDGVTFHNVGFFTGLAPDNYILSIKDGSGCIETISIPLQDPTDFSFDGFEVINDDCSDDNIGQITVLASGSGLTYSIDGTSFQTSNIFSGLSPGNYTITIKNTNGCERVESTPVRLSGITISHFDVVNTSCGQDTGSITVVASSTGTLSYSIDGGSPQSSPTFNNLEIGSYVIDIFDTNGCSLKRTVVVQSTLVVTTDITDANCNQDNGSVIVNINEPGTYSYSIDGTNFQSENEFTGLGSGTYTVTINDDTAGCSVQTTFGIGEVKSIDITEVIKTPSACASPTGTLTIIAEGDNLNYSIDDGETFLPSNVFMDLAPGNYPIVVKDVFDCEEHVTATIIEENTVDIININTSISECAVPTGIIEITATGTGALSYSIDGENFQSNNTFTDQYSGSYTIYVRDESGCEASRAAAVIENNDISITDIQVVAATGACVPDGEIEIIATGSNVQYSIDGVNYQSSGLFQDLLPKTYIIYLKSDRGCERETGSILIQGGYEIPELDVTNTTCRDGVGSINIRATGPNVKYSLDNITYQESGSFTGLTLGVYTIYVGDGEGCYITAEAEIVNNGFVVIDAVETVASTCGDPNGSITITASSEEADSLEFSIDGSAFLADPVFTNLTSGTYTITVRDNFGCTATQDIFVDRSPPLVVDIKGVNPICAEENGEVKIIVTGGTAPYRYSLNGQEYNQTGEFKNLAIGTYTIIVEDALGCMFTSEIILDRDCKALLPTAIAPNGNGRNECLQLLYYTNVDITTYQIFDRWGSLIYDGDSFNSIEYSKFWDGTIDGSVNAGVFAYHIAFVNEKGEQKTMKGNVTVIR